MSVRVSIVRKRTSQAVMKELRTRQLNIRRFFDYRLRCAMQKGVDVFAVARAELLTYRQHCDVSAVAHENAANRSK